MLTISQVEELMNQKLKEQKRSIMLTMCGRVSHPFTLEMIQIIIYRDLTTQTIPDYMGKGDPIQYIHKHKLLFLGRTGDNNHFTLLF